MIDEFVRSILKKNEVDVTHFMRHYKHFDNDDWFAPNNNIEEDFTVAEYMHQLGLLEKKRIPIWNNGSFNGFKILFKKL